MRLVVLLLAFAVGLVAILLAASIGATIYGALQQASSQVLVHINSAKVQPIATLTVTAYIGPNTTIAPHLFDWYISGSNIGFHYFSYTPTSVKIEAMVKIPPQPSGTYVYHNDILSTILDALRFATGTYFNDNGYVYFRSLYALVLWKTKIPFGVNVWRNVTLVLYNASGADVIIDGTKYSYAPDIDVSYWTSVKGKWLTTKSGAGPIEPGYYAYVKVWEDGKLKTFVDATFYNGTHYIDIIDGDVVQEFSVQTFTRVPAEKRWLWVVRGVRGDNLVHFEWFPAGSVVEVYNASSGDLVARFVCLGERDITLNLPNGTYRIVAQIPIPHTVVVNEEEVSVSVPESWGDVKFNVTVVQPLDYLAPGDLVVWNRGVVSVVHGGAGGDKVVFSGFPAGARVYLQVPGGAEWYLFTSDGGNASVALPLVFEPRVRVDVEVTAPAPLTVKVERGAALVETPSGVERLEEGEQLNLYAFTATVAPAPAQQVYPTVAAAVAIIAPWLTVILALALVAVFAHTRRR